MTFLWRVWPAPWFHQQGHIHESCLQYVLHMPLVGYWILCMRYAQYILFFMFCGLGQHSGYSDLLWASPGCGINHPPLSSAEVKESVELYSPCRPWMPVVGWNLFFTFFCNCLSLWGQGSMVRIATGPLAGWFWVQILVGTKDFSLLQNVQSNVGAHPVFFMRVHEVLSQD